jgi:CDP-diglyceride synthetase
MANRRDTIRAGFIVVLVSAVPWLLFNVWSCYRADDLSRCIRTSVNIWTGVAVFIVGVLGLRVVWAVIGWASNISGTRALRLVKTLVLALGILVPLLVIAQAEMNYSAIIKSVTSPWFVLMWLVVVYLSWTWASVSPYNTIKTWFTIYATIIVLMWLASHGVFRDSEDFSSTDDLPSILADRERLLRNVVFYSLAALAGVMGRTWKERRGKVQVPGNRMN